MTLLLGPSTQSIVDAATAKDRRIPAIRLNEGNLVQLGYGARARRIWTAETDVTSAIGADIARDKDLTNRLLADCGLPVPPGVRVEGPEAAWAAAQAIGLPVVLKPVDGNHGRGVSVDLCHQPRRGGRLRRSPASEGSGVICERFVRGVEHRLLVVGGRMLAAARGEEAWVTGDGGPRVARAHRCPDQQRPPPRPDRGLSAEHDPHRGRTPPWPWNWSVRASVGTAVPAAGGGS